MGRYGVPVTQEPLTRIGAQPDASQSRRRSRRPIWLVAGIVLAVLAAGGIYLLVRPTSFDLHGSLQLRDRETIRSACLGQGGYSDIRVGAQVFVTDASGKTVGIGQVENSENKGLFCDYAFVVRDVPAGLDFYGVEVSKRGRVQYSEEQVRSGITLSLGAG